MKVRLEWNYQIPKSKKTYLLTTDFMSVQDILYMTRDIEKTGRVKQLQYFDQMDSEWTKKELEKLLEKEAEEPQQIIAYFDGGFDKPTKTAGLGVVIYYEKNGQKFRIRKNERIEEIESNNEAEYAALWNLLLQLEEQEVHHTELTIKGDSLVVINQLTNEWPCYEEDLERWLDRIEKKTKQLGYKVNYQSVSRKENREADQLASQALNEIFISSHSNLNDGES
ncbi:reverse transcriptase-like protein [Alkalihalobacterium chitinilyticum]|uniref:Reverse transcriptase-like protein n=1 Tax=Alkalihalobacterium chitinilyticum TaxID=2980103 RepID=A0ABT5VBH7_9BACI|nr:reverse transcriptase-like protein [Alkalihalobacterium chitinilyticum]MDE5412818.1 reverse transcriptase-like protein [Alkalihalobacterium chitinilyticum]